ncbi:hypothetical protein DUNSADRAFT_3350 [Dunaliella salina]|uniref:Uncharacterized protein n=1 Tax=Dunaliella salina TaxID=3046 RepID=A0ABQ7FVH7_DUNSA|nr:hypothetical protein DUNSADRAFT_3350 [Dunaliella salina]|eukprot:KAF5826384.1 hypothetical protein DUNSADRAFT_3350 [Dunaliella salina]
MGDIGLWMQFWGVGHKFDLFVKTRRRNWILKQEKGLPGPPAGYRWEMKHPQNLLLFQLC